MRCAPDDPKRGLDRNPWLACTYHGLQMSLFPAAVITLYWNSAIGMSMTEIMALQAYFGAVLAAAEFPSGHFADRFGYRRTLMLAAGLGTAGWVVYASAPSLAGVLAAETLLALGMSLASGADNALLYESLVAREQEADYGRWFGRYRFSGQFCEGCSALAAGALFFAWPRSVFVIQIGLWALNVAVAAAMREPPRASASPHGLWRGLTTLARRITHEDPVLRATVGLGLSLGLASFLPVWLIQLYARDAGVPTTWLGPIWAVANFSVALAALGSDFGVRRLGRNALLGLCVLAVGVGYFGLGFSHGLYGFCFYFALTIMRGFNGPALQHVKQRRIASRDRAALTSIASAGLRICFLIVAPLVGWAIDRHGQHPVLLAAGSALLVTGGLWWRAFVRARKHDVPE